MAETAFAAGARTTRWSKTTLAEFTRELEFASAMGKHGSSSPIQLLKELMSLPGHIAVFSWLARLSGAGVEDDNLLMGNEESGVDYVQTVTSHMYRNAVLVGEYERDRGVWDLLGERKDSLKDWAKDLLRGHILRGYLSGNVDGNELYSSCSEGEKDALSAANNDRMLYGSILANNTGDSDVDLAKIDITDDTFIRAALMTMRRLANAADPRITPVKVKNFGNHYMCWAGSNNFRDFETDCATNIWAESEVRGKGNSLYQAGDILYRGTVIRETPDITPIAGVGAAAAAVGQVILSGAQSFGLAWEKKPVPIQRTDDYGGLEGIGIKQTYGFARHMQNDVMIGMVLGMFAAASDA